MRVLSGIRATGRLHLGNYLGALKRFAEYSQDPEMDCMFFAADLHTLTTHKEAASIGLHLPAIILDFLAAGIDPERSIIYVQSDVPSLGKLNWLLACLAPYGELNRMKTFQEKAEKRPDDVNAGLFSYPVLMAADILGPRADLVPVGADQQAHLEFAQNIARRANNLIGEDFFPIPDALRQEMIMVPGLEAMTERGDFPKMGKSDNNTINLSDTPEQVWDKVRVAPTDPARIRRTDPGTPQHCVMYSLHSFVSSADDIRWVLDGCTSAGIGCVECKRRLSTNINTLLEPFQEKRRQLAENPDMIREILHEGAKRARAIIDPTVDHLEEAMGIVRYLHD